MLYRESIELFVSYLEKEEYAHQTITGYKKDLLAMSRWFENKNNVPIYVKEIDKNNIDDYLEDMKSRGCAATTRNRFLFVLRSYFSFAVERNLKVNNPVEGVKPVRTRIKERTYLKKEEVESLAKEISHPVIRNAVLTAYFTGLRPSELVNLTIQDVDLQSKIIQVRKGKGNKDRSIPINKELKGILANYLDHDRPEVDSEKVFATARSGSLSLQYLNRKIKEAVLRLKWKKDVTAHTLRHSFASRLVANDVNIVKIQHLLGHSSITVTAVYSHFGMDDLSKALKKL